MDKGDRETLDFMNVESFSQLPFIRPAPPPLKGAGAIRLFGKEFAAKDDQSNSTGNNNNNNDDDNPGDQDADKTGVDSSETSSRKFECHYCCRNFPTSQALGGHQNAHKRERQQAKRAHLQSAMVHGGLADAHVYGFMNYGRLASAPALPISYHSWNNNSGSYSANSRLYGSYPAQPINGSPLALWRIPSAHGSPVLARDRPMHQAQLFGSRDEPKPLSSMSSISASQFRFGYESKPEMQDHVSLDLHL